MKDFFVVISKKLLLFISSKYIGKISYGMYIYHTIAMGLLNRFFVFSSSLYLFFCVYIVTIFLAALSWKYIEHPLICFVRKTKWSDSAILAS